MKHVKQSGAILLLFGLTTLLSDCAHNAADDMQKLKQAGGRLRAAEPKYVAQYDVSLIEVQRPSEAKAQFGDMKISQLDTDKGRVFNAQDGLIAVVWTGPSNQLNFDLINKGESPVKVLWDEAAYVDIKGQTHRVIHSGVKLAERNSPQPASVIPSKGKLDDMVYPSDHVSYSDSASSGGWSQRHMFPCMTVMVCKEDQRALTIAHTGMNYRVLLPVQVGKDNFPYTFVFHVNKAEVVTVEVGEGSK